MYTYEKGRSMWRISEFSKITGLSPDTLRNYEKQGKLTPLRSPGGWRYYTEEHLKQLFNIQQPESKIETVIYARESTPQQKDSLERQVSMIKTFCVSRGYKIDEVITDIGSAVNFKRPGFLKLLEYILFNRCKRIVIASRDRLLRIGFELIEKLCSDRDIELVVIDNTSTDSRQEIVEDLIHIFHYFAMKLYGARAYKQKEQQFRRLLDEDSNNSDQRS